MLNIIYISPIIMISISMFIGTFIYNKYDNKLNDKYIITCVSRNE